MSVRPKKIRVTSLTRNYVKSLEVALVRAAMEHGHKWGCSAARGLDSECTCGWVAVKQLARSIQNA